MPRSRRSTRTREAAYAINASSPLSTGTSIGPAAILPGTVASRVQYLQSLSNSTDPTGAQQASKGHRQENYRTAYGRRATGRFGVPALQNQSPHRESQVKTTHLFRGLVTPRTKHVAEHADSYMAIQPMKSSTSQEQSSGGVPRLAQNDTVIPWAGLSRGKSARSMGRKSLHVSIETVKELGPRPSRSDISPRQSMFDSPSMQNNFGTVVLREDTEKSESTMTTTSTIRRKSVRDLFDEYGIERPYGLANSRKASRAVGAKRQASHNHICCDLCAWINKGTSDVCWRCGHSLRSKDATELVLPFTRRCSLDSVERLFEYLDRPSAGEQLPQKVMRRTRPWPTPLQPDGPIRQRLSTKKFPPFFEPATQPNEAKPILLSLLQGSKVTKSIKESPFMVADSLFRSKPLQVKATSENGDSADNKEAEYRQTIDGQSFSTARGKSRTGHRCTKARLTATPSMRLVAQSTASNSPRRTIRTSQKSGSCEYVACNGYPKTGHFHRGSPVSAGVVGTCQHCLDDCPCEACQDAQHSVRCCVHADHQSIVHQHTRLREGIRRSASKVTSEESEKTSSPRSPLIPTSEKLPEPVTPIEKLPALTVESESSLTSKIFVPSATTSTTTAKTTLHPIADGTRKPSTSFLEPLSRKSVLHKKSTLPHPKTFALTQLVKTPTPPLVACPKIVETFGDPVKRDFLGTSLPPKSRKSDVQDLRSQPLHSSRQSPKSTRRFSAMFQLSSMTSVPLLNQKLREHQEELRKLHRETTAGISSGSVKKWILALEHESTADGETTVAKTQQRETVETELQDYRPRLLDQEPGPADEVDVPKLLVQRALSNVQHFAPGDGIVGQEGDGVNNPLLGAYIQLPTINLEDHTRGIGFDKLHIKSVMVVLHMEGREDMVFRADRDTGWQVNGMG